MKWLGGLAGLLFGLVVGRFEAALTWMLLGFLGGGAVDFFRKRGAPPAAAASDAATAEIARILRLIEDLHVRLKRLEGQAEVRAVPARAFDAGPGLANVAGEQAAAVAPGEQLSSDPATHAPDLLPVTAGVALNGSVAPVASAADQPDQAPPATEAEPRRPSVLEPIMQWLVGGNTVLKVGIIILFFGVAFLIKYAADSGILPIELRLAGVAAAGIAFLVGGFRLRDRGAAQSAYGLALQGAGIGILYLSIFGAFRFYQLLPGGFAFALMVAVVGLSAALAVLQNSLALAAFGSVGGFLAPVLASSGGGSHVALFSFYALLNTGIFAIAWFRSWRLLNLIGFVFTFGIGSLWGAWSYRPEHFASTEPFLILVFLFYVAIAVLYALREAPRLRSVVDGTLVFGTPMIAFGLQARLVGDFEYGAAYSAVAVAFFYLGLTRWLLARRCYDLRLLAESFLALGVIFLTLAVPLALDGRWTSATWAVEGAAIVWAGSRQNKWLARAFGYLVQAGGAATFLAHWGDGLRSQWPVLNAQWLGLALIAAAALFTARLIVRHGERFGDFERRSAPAIFVLGAAAWVVAGVAEIGAWSRPSGEPQAVTVFFVASAWVFHLLGRALAWPHAARTVLALLPGLVLTLLWAIDINRHPFAVFGWLIWPLAIASHYHLLRAAEADSMPPGTGLPRSLHALGVWTVALIGAVELHCLTQAENLRHSAWSVAAAMVPLALTVLALSSAGLRRRWPVAAHPAATLVWGAAPLLLLIWLWVFYANLTHAGGSAPLPYLPLLNAIDLGHLLALLAFIAWRGGLRAEAIEVPVQAPWMFVAVGGAGFVWLNGVLLRTIHHWAGVPYRLDALMRSVLTQTALSIFWTVLALALMLVATRRATRGLWFVGASLMAVVVAKLFVVDLSNIGGVERIVSFIGVGLLMLIIGYVAPLPPKSTAATLTRGEVA